MEPLDFVNIPPAPKVIPGQRPEEPDQQAERLTSAAHNVFDREVCQIELLQVPRGRDTLYGKLTLRKLIQYSTTKYLNPR